MAAHIHGPATVEQTVGVMVDLESLNSGGFGESGSSWHGQLIPEQLGAVIDLNTYTNAHGGQPSERNPRPNPSSRYDCHANAHHAPRERQTA
ncbi:MAG: hypothetical protein M2R45_05192 [Verrucomicrobia subdivision 3 bacterium]|nr:hypothetical protein [Limisphaerales bacterium]MCS1417583.1 hypothetical protein [Limisphaerales bacterium]